MTPNEFRELLDLMGWSQRGFAKLIGRSEGTVRQWARGALPIPENVSMWMLIVCAPMQDTPTPSMI